MSDPLNVKQRLDSETPQRHIPTPEVSLKDRFFRYFQHEITGKPAPHYSSGLGAAVQMNEREKNRYSRVYFL
jgi:hypothetical protein